MVAELDGVAVVVREANIYERDDTSFTSHIVVQDVPSAHGTG